MQICVFMNINEKLRYMYERKNTEHLRCVPTKLRKNAAKYPRLPNSILMHIDANENIRNGGKFAEKISWCS